MNPPFTARSIALLALALGMAALPFALVRAQDAAEPAEAATPKIYEYREMGLRALGDGIYATAARFFTAYRDAAEFREPEFADATALLIQAHLGRGAVKAAAEAEALHAANSPGCEEPFYTQTLTCWRNALAIRQGKAEQAARNLEALLQSTRFPEITNLASFMLGEAYIQIARWKDAETVLQSVVKDDASPQRALQAQLALVRILVAQEQYGAARERLAALEARADVPPQLLVLQRILIDMAAGDIDAAMNAFAQVADGSPKIHRENWWTVFSHLAGKLVALERWADAVKVITAAESLAPDSGERVVLRFQLAEVYRSMGEQGKAMEALQALREEVRGTPDEIDVEIKLAQIAKKMNDLATAARHFQAVAQNDSAANDVRHRAAMSQGWCLNELKDFAAAVDVFTHAGDLAPTGSQRATALLFAGDAAAQAGNLADAVARYQTVAEELADTPVAATARLRQARTLAQQDRFADAVAAFRKFLTEHTQDDRISEAMLELGIALGRAGEADASVQALNDFVKRFPEDENAPRALMEAYRSARLANRLETAMRLLSKLCTDYSGSDLYATALYHRIHTAFLLGDVDLALTDAEKFVRDFPGLPMAADVLLWLGDHYRAVGNCERAMEHYLRTPMIHPDLPQAQSALLAAADCALLLGDSAKAETLVQELLDTKPEKRIPQVYARAALMRGNILADKAEFAAAMDAYRKIAEIEPDSRLAQIGQGRVADMLFTLGEKENLEKAEDIYEKLLENKELPANVRASLRFRWARTLEALERTQDALDTYLEVVFEYDVDVRAGRIRDWFHFARSADRAAKILIGQGQVDAAARVYERIEKSGIPYAVEAGERAEEIRNAHDIQN